MEIFGMETNTLKLFAHQFYPSTQGMHMLRQRLLEYSSILVVCG